MVKTLILGVISLPLLAQQQPCANTPAYSPCEITFELSAQEASAHPNPYVTVNVQAEFRSPHFKTYLLPAYWDGGNRMVIRFTPPEPGDWIYRISGNIPAWNKQGNFTATASENQPFIRPANLHHWVYVDTYKAHLWMGDTCYRFVDLDQSTFENYVNTRAGQKFNHIRGLIITDPAKAFPKPDRPDPAHFQKLDQYVRYMNSKGIIADLILADGQNALAKLMPDWQQRKRFIRYLIGRYSPFNITWQGVRAFEQYENGRELLKEIGQEIKTTDPYLHPRSSGTLATSAPLLDDGWMNFVADHSSDDQLCAIEHQIYPAPIVNLEFGIETAQNADAFRRRIWNATMDGTYLTYANTATKMSGSDRFDAAQLDSPGAKEMKIWHDFFDDTRYWELEPYFDVDNGRAVALEGVEYVVYVEKPGPTEVLVEKHGYDVFWVNPATGESTKAKNFKGERWTGEPPSKDHDWVLHISREGRKEGMLKSYKFDSRETPLALQEIERVAQKIPFEIEAPVGDILRPGRSVPYGAKIKRETRATRSMMWLWTGEVTAGAQGFRVLGTGQRGTLVVPPEIARGAGDNGVINLRVYGMNANGKVYSLDKAYQIK